MLARVVTGSCFGRRALIGSPIGQLSGRISEMGKELIGYFLRRCTLVALYVLLLAGCATREPFVETAAYPNFAVPVVPEELVGTPSATAHDRAWLFLQADELEVAKSEFSAIVVSNPAFHPSYAGLGFVLLAEKRPDSSIDQFTRALERVPIYVPALLGRAEALLIVDRPDEAVVDLSAALSADPSLTALRPRIAELEFSSLMAQVALARAASDDGRSVEAKAAYERIIEVSPESSFLYIELAQVERRLDDLSAALESLKQAVSLDPNAPEAWLSMGEIYLSKGNLDRAEQALFRADTIDPTPEIEAVLNEIEARRRLASLPREYSAIESEEALSRAQLAALIGVGFDGTLAVIQSDSAAIIIDSRGHWAYDWIIAVVQAGVMEPDVNYRFQPDVVVTRVEMARVIARLMRLAEVEPIVVGQPNFSDVAEGHLDFPAVAEAVAAGLLPLEDGIFQPGRPVGGVEAILALDRLVEVVEDDR